MFVNQKRRQGLLLFSFNWANDKEIERERERERERESLPWCVLSFSKSLIEQLDKKQAIQEFYLPRYERSGRKKQSHEHIPDFE